MALSAAISKEDFEEAARLRDELKGLRIAAAAPVAQVAEPKVAEPEVRNLRHQKKQSKTLTNKTEPNLTMRACL